MTQLSPAACISALCMRTINGTVLQLRISLFSRSSTLASACFFEPREFRYACSRSHARGDAHALGGERGDTHGSSGFALRWGVERSVVCETVLLSSLLKVFFNGLTFSLPAAGRLALHCLRALARAASGQPAQLLSSGASRQPDCL